MVTRVFLSDQELWGRHLERERTFCLKSEWEKDIFTKALSVANFEGTYKSCKQIRVGKFVFEQIWDESNFHAGLFFLEKTKRGQLEQNHFPWILGMWSMWKHGIACKRFQQRPSPKSMAAK